MASESVVADDGSQVGKGPGGDASAASKPFGAVCVPIAAESCVVDVEDAGVGQIHPVERPVPVPWCLGISVNVLRLLASSSVCVLLGRPTGFGREKRSAS